MGETITITYNSVFSNDSRNLYTRNFNGETECVGVTTDAYLEMKETAELALAKAEEYFEELVQNGLRERPKTEAEKIAELEEKLAKSEENSKKIEEQNVQILDMLNQLLEKGADENVGHKVNSEKGRTKRQSDNKGDVDSDKVQ